MPALRDGTPSVDDSVENQRGMTMWDVVGIVAGVVVIILMFQILDFTETLKVRLKGGSTSKDLELRVKELEKRLDAVEKKSF